MHTYCWRGNMRGRERDWLQNRTELWFGITRWETPGNSRTEQNRTYLTKWGKGAGRQNLIERSCLWFVYPLKEEIRLKIFGPRDFTILLLDPLSDGTPFKHLKICLKIWGLPWKMCFIWPWTPVKTCWKFWHHNCLKSDLLRLWIGICVYVYIYICT